MIAHPALIVLPRQVLRASAGVTGSGTQAIDGDKNETGYKTFLGHLFDLLEEKINTDRYEEAVRQLVGNRVRTKHFMATMNNAVMRLSLEGPPADTTTRFSQHVGWL